MFFPARNDSICMSCQHTTGPVLHLMACQGGELLQLWPLSKHSKNCTGLVKYMTHQVYSFSFLIYTDQLYFLFIYFISIYPLFHLYPFHPTITTLLSISMSSPTCLPDPSTPPTSLLSHQSCQPTLCHRVCLYFAWQFNLFIKFHI